MVRAFDGSLVVIGIFCTGGLASMDFRPYSERAGEKSSFMEVHGRWCERFDGRPFDQPGMDEMRAMVAKLP